MEMAIMGGCTLVKVHQATPMTFGLPCLSTVTTNVYGYGELNSMAVLRSISPIEISFPVAKDLLYTGKSLIAMKMAG
jgi:hypothetical protein